MQSSPKKILEQRHEPRYYEDRSQIPKRKFLTVESIVASYREELSGVSEAELDEVKRIRDEVSATYKDSLFCECGGALEREKILFCPKCRSTELSYQMHKQN